MKRQLKRINKSLRKTYYNSIVPYRMKRLFRAIQFGRNGFYHPVTVKGTLYAGKRNTDDRWTVIRDVLKEFEPDSVLDVGCAEGWILRSVNEEFDCFTLGIDGLSDRVLTGEIARLMDDIPFYSIMKKKLAPEDIRKLPKFDVIICLSLVHHIIKINGVDAGRDFVSALRERTNKAMVFEMGSSDEKLMKWHQDMPEMEHGQTRFMTTFLESCGLRNVRKVGEGASTKRDSYRVILVGEA
ncbi:MAG: hypothetical protein ACQETM_10390 [Bacteroidota bacterium]